MPVWKQEGRSIGVESRTGIDLVLLGIKGESEISTPFCYQLELASTVKNIDANSIIGQPLDVWLESADGTKHYLNGYVNRFAAGPAITSERRVYRVQIVPWLWFLSKSTDCRIFQDQTAAQIIGSIFDEYNGNSHINLNVSYESSLETVENRSLETLSYCVQYHETDLEFISRLAKENGLIYFFKQVQGMHTLVLTDLATAYVNCAEYNVDQTAGGPIDQWDVDYDFTNPRWAVRDFNYTNSTAASQIVKSTSPSLSETAPKNFENFEYASGFNSSSTGEKIINRLLDEEDSSSKHVSATSGYKSFFAGGQFKLKTHDFCEEVTKVYTITKILFEASELSYHTGLTDPATYSHTGLTDPATYSNEFSAIPTGKKYFSDRPCRRPVMHGPQTAIVVGPANNKVYTDTQGRVKVQFHWDRRGQNNESSSCWLRVSQSWAGKGWGYVALPHVGHEVIVSFLEGNPDLPIITGRVYNAANMPPENPSTNFEKNILKDDFDNRIVLDATDNKEHILLRSPVQKSKIEVGKTDSGNDSGVRIETEGNIVTKGKKSHFDFTLGSSHSATVGSAFSGFVGAKFDVSAGVFGSLTGALKYDCSFGGTHTLSAGYTNAWTLNTWINATNAAILNVAKKDVITGAGEALCFVANCNDATKERSIMYANGDKISLSMGSEFTPEATGAHNEWYNPYGNPAMDIARLAAMVAASGLAGGAVVAHEEENETLAWVLGLAAIAIFTGATIEQLNEFRVNNKNSAVKPITHDTDTEALKIELDKTKGIKINAKDKPVELSMKENDETFGLFLNENGDLFLGLKNEKSFVGIDSSGGDILISTEDNSSGDIAIISKGEIFLKSEGDINIKSDSFFEANGNFKVLKS